MEVLLVPKVNLSSDERSVLFTLLDQENKLEGICNYVEHLLLVAYNKGVEHKGSLHISWEENGASINLGTPIKECK